MRAVDNTEAGHPQAASGEFERVDRPAGASSALPEFSIDDIMWRVRAEVTRRRNGHIVAVGSPGIPDKVQLFDLSMPRWKPAMAHPSVKDKYDLAELLGFADADFIDVAYRTILRRPPDETGFNYYLQRLRSGASSKIAILQEFSSAPEAQRFAVQIEGLAMSCRLEKWRRKKLIGPLIAWLHALLRLGSLAGRQTTLDMIQARETQELGRLVNEASEHLLQRITALKVDFAGRVVAAEFETLKNEVTAAEVRLQQLGTKVERELARRPDTTAFAALKEDSAALGRQLGHLNAEVQSRLQSSQEGSSRLESGLNSIAASVRHLLARDERPFMKGDLDPFYAAFEDRFRGDRATIRTRVEPYLDLMREVGAGSIDAPVLDIGSGRGEWLELLRDSGLIARGIDINRVFIDTCRGRGLDIIEGDAIETLQAMPAGAAGAITCMHLAEHLPFERLIAVLDEAKRVLRPGGILVLETPNPENLFVGQLLFYMDPTHRNPLPPEALRWVVEARGFLDARIERLNATRLMSIPAPLPKETPGAEAINTILASLGEAQDYAIIAKRP